MQKQPKVNDIYVSVTIQSGVQHVVDGATQLMSRCTQTAKCFTCGKTGHFSNMCGHHKKQT